MWPISLFAQPVASRLSRNSAGIGGMNISRILLRREKSTKKLPDQWRLPMLTRRRLLETAGAGIALAGSSLGPKSAGAAMNLPAALPQGVRDNAILDALPGKKPLIKLSYRPPNYETPIEYFRTAITPNDAFFVRYHL